MKTNKLSPMKRMLRWRRMLPTKKHLSTHQVRNTGKSLKPHERSKPVKRSRGIHDEEPDTKKIMLDDDEMEEEANNDGIDVESCSTPVRNARSTEGAEAGSGVAMRGKHGADPPRSLVLGCGFGWGVLTNAVR